MDDVSNNKPPKPKSSTFRVRVPGATVEGKKGQGRRRGKKRLRVRIHVAEGLGLANGTAKFQQVPPDVELPENSSESKEKSEPDYSLVLKSKFALKLVEEDGLEFLKLLSKEVEVEITIRKQLVNDSLAFVCIIDGPEELKVKALVAIKRFYNPLHSEHVCLLKRFNNGDFKLQNAQELLIKLGNEIDWQSSATMFHAKLKKLKDTFEKHSSPLNLARALCGQGNPQVNLQSLADDLKRHYRILNFILLGKLNILGGRSRFSLLEQWGASGEVSEPPDDVKEAFSYLCEHSTPLNTDYAHAISLLPHDITHNEKRDMQGLYQSGLNLCKQYKWEASAEQTLRKLYVSLLVSNYSASSVSAFRTHCGYLQFRYETEREKL